MDNRIKKIFKIISRLLAVTLAVLVLLVGINFLLQGFVAHKEGDFVPDYEKIKLTEDTDYETFFKQTGLGKLVIDKLLAEDRFSDILKAQELFFATPDTSCNKMLGFFTMEDRLEDSDSTPFYDLQKGDILITLSTHSLGWRHGHAALVVGDKKILECQSMGQVSSENGIYYWGNYTNYAVLRLKEITPELQKDVAKFAKNNLTDLPYKLTSGIFEPKEIDLKQKNAGFYCTNLIWYAWNNFGFDLDSDGGKIVTSKDLLYSDKLEVVQLFGMNPNEFID